MRNGGPEVAGKNEADDMVSVRPDGIESVGSATF
jgi:hypothetical protein